MNLPRRKFLRLGGAAAATGLVSAVASPAFADVLAKGSGLVTKKARKIALHNLHTGESINTEYWAEGEHIPEALTAVNKVLRDWRNDEIHTIDPKLIDMLSLMRSWMDRGDEPFQVISGYRAPATNAKMHAASSGVAKNSLHMVGKAIDIRMSGCDLKNLHGAALKMRCGGVGYYPVSDFVHMDTGRVRRWSGA